MLKKSFSICGWAEPSLDFDMMTSQTCLTRTTGFLFFCKFSFLKLNLLRVLGKNLENSLQNLRCLLEVITLNIKLYRVSIPGIFSSSAAGSHLQTASKPKKQESASSNHHDGVASQPPSTSCQYVS